ncbi:MAG TPA: hypothetical protein VKV57_11735 [bacterium]|nr:hypothetical protein [bacterium]
MRPKQTEERNGRERPPDRPRPGGRSIDIHGLLTNREYIKVTAYVLPRRTKIRVLDMMERLRQRRRARPPAAEGRPGPIPEMTGGELVREINWRIGTLPPEDAEALVRYLGRLTRWRRGRRGGTDPTAPGARGDPG